MKYKYKKYINAPHYSILNIEYMAPGKKVWLNCNLLIRQAMITTTAAIENGTGNEDELVNTYTLVSMQCVPFV